MKLQQRLKWLHKVGPFDIQHKQWYHSKECAGANFSDCFTPYADLSATKSFSKVGRKEQTVQCRAQTRL